MVVRVEQWPAPATELVTAWTHDDALPSLGASAEPRGPHSAVAASLKYARMEQLGTDLTQAPCIRDMR